MYNRDLHAWQNDQHIVGTQTSIWALAKMCKGLRKCQEAVCTRKLSVSQEIDQQNNTSSQWHFAQFKSAILKKYQGDGKWEKE